MAQMHECDLCGASFERNNDLGRHMWIHSGEKPYKCTLCDHQAIKMSNFRNHMNTHTKAKPYECRQCAKSYTEPGSLTRHKKTKHGYKPPERKTRTQPKVVVKRVRKSYSRPSKLAGRSPTSSTPEFIPPSIAEAPYNPTSALYDYPAARSRFAPAGQSSFHPAEQINDQHEHYARTSEHSPSCYTSDSEDYYTTSSATYSDASPSPVDEESPFIRHPLHIGFPSPPARSGWSSINTFM